MLTSNTNPNLAVARSGHRRKLAFGWTLRHWVLLAFLSLLTFAPQAAVAQDFNMPWMDAETGNPKPVDLRDREDALTRDRIKIPDYIPKKVAKKKTNAMAPAAWPNSVFDFGWMTPGLIRLFLVVPIVVISILVVWMVMRTKFAVRDNQDDDTDSRRRSIAESIKHLPFELDSNVEGDFRYHASQAYQAGNYKRAVICLFSHVLVSMDQDGILRLKKGKTNRQYLREIQTHQELAKYYGQVMVPFEETFFGDHAIGKSTFEECWSGLDQFQSNLKSAKTADG